MNPNTGDIITGHVHIRTFCNCYYRKDSRGLRVSRRISGLKLDRKKQGRRAILFTFPVSAESDHDRVKMCHFFF